MALLENFLLTVYGNRQHRGDGMDCSLLEAYTRFARDPEQLARRLLTPEKIGSLMLAPPLKATVRNMAIHIEISGRTEYYRHGDFYWLTGKQVQVQVDPSDLASAFVFFDGRCICRALRVAKAAYGAPQEVIATESRLKHYIVKSTKKRLKLLSAATFVPTAQEMAAMRAEVQGARVQGSGISGVPHAESLERAPRRREVFVAPQNPTSEETAEWMMQVMKGKTEL